MRALPMFLGLDLRGGVYFLMQVDMKSALTKKAESLTGDIRTLLRDKNLRHAGITRNGDTVDVRFRDRQTLAAAFRVPVSFGSPASPPSAHCRSGSCSPSSCPTC